MPSSFAWAGDMPQLLSVTIAIDFIIWILPVRIFDPGRCFVRELPGILQVYHRKPPLSFTV